MKQTDLKHLKRLVQHVLDYLDECGIEDEVRLASTTDRILQALERAPEYKAKYPKYARYLDLRAMTMSMVIRALGSRTKGISEAMELLIQQEKVARITVTDMRTRGPKPDMFILASYKPVYEMMLQKQKEHAAQQMNSDPFAHEYVPPWRNG